MSASELAIYGPTIPFSAELHAQKYRQPGESFKDSCDRLANTLGDNPEHTARFRDSLYDMRFLPGGRIQAAIGSSRNVTGMSCYVLPVEDSYVEGENSIMDTAKNAAATMRMGGGCGYNFSKLRPKGAEIKKLQSQSSGPMSFMEIFDAVCRCTASSGHRRGAQMGILDVAHPDIEDFIACKHNTDRFTGFNISIAISDEFMQAVAAGREFNLRYGGQVFKTVDAQALWDKIMHSTWDWAEPGVVFMDAINRMNNLWYCENIRATNPCSEQPLPDFGACLLGSFNIPKYLTMSVSGAWGLDLEMFVRDIQTCVRAMDNVVDWNRYPLPQQQREQQNKRRMGLGITGLANAAEAQGYSYGSRAFVEFEKLLLHVLMNECYKESARIAGEKGAFPLYDQTKYSQGQFYAKLDNEARWLIQKYGIRNSHLTSIAPTGTISLCADNISSGIEPVFDYSFSRTVQEFAGPRTETVTDYGVRVFGVKGKRCKDVTPKEHVDVLVAAQDFVDSAVSKTCNVDSRTDFKEFKNIYFDAWERGAKGCTTFRTDGKRAGVLVSKEAGAESCEFDPTTGLKNCG